MGRSFHRPGTVKENVLESDFEPLCDGTTRRRSLADLKFTFTFSRHFYSKRLANEDNRSNQNQQKSNNMQVL